uniref:Potassium/proton antiporter CemA n=1 Tax=Lygodium japonicum TaxID=13824 RepID=S4UBP5_LYGJA|nr:envelope membrane protein [Lygodium japonicum]AGI51380.1 envelope membrane protein [Lygodium japonicum]AHA59633.1 chloroplast envelope membrane protein [Lygodium japonicum]
MELYRRKLVQWFYKAPNRSLGRAYETSKQMKYLRKRNFLFHRQTESSTNYYRWARSAEAQKNTVIHKMYLCLIYWSLLECRINFFLSKIWNNLELFFESKRFQSWVVGSRDDDLKESNVSLRKKSQQRNRNHPTISPFCLSETSPLPSSPLSQKYRSTRSPCGSAKKYGSEREKKIEEMNRKLAWIELFLNNSNNIEDYYRSISPTSRVHDPLNEEVAVDGSIDSSSGTTAYESTSFIPRSINRTLSKFEAELTSHPSPLVLHDFQLARYQALSSIRYIGYLIILPFLVTTVIKERFLEPWIRQFWNTSQPQIFINSFQEERTLNRLQEIEGLLWLNETMGNYNSIQLWNCDTDACNETIQSVVMYNEANIQTILRLATDITSIITSIFLFAMGRRSLAVPNSWIQELFYSLNDTMKAFLIPSLTDLRVGFHSPHGWEIITGCFLERLGLARNKYVISCFVSTFPVISDTVFKYWIFRHLNRASPSIVATYHTMNE